MNWRDRLKQFGIPGYIVLGVILFAVVILLPFYGPKAIVELGPLSLMFLHYTQSFYQWAYGPHTNWSRRIAYYTFILVFELVLPLMGIGAIVQMIRKWRSPTPAGQTTTPPSGRHQPYEDHLGRLIQAANRLSPGQAVSDDLRRDVARLLFLFDQGFTQIVGEHRRLCRVIWIVRNDQGPPTALSTRPEDRGLGNNEEQAVWTCFTQNWFIRVSDIRTNALFQANPPERMEALICARNLSEWKIGLVIAIDRLIPNFEGISAALLVMIALMMPLWDLDMMRRLMLDLTQEDVEGVQAQ